MGIDEVSKSKRGISEKSVRERGADKREKWEYVKKNVLTQYIHV